MLGNHYIMSIDKDLSTPIHDAPLHSQDSIKQMLQEAEANKRSRIDVSIVRQVLNSGDDKQTIRAMKQLETGK